MSTLSREKWGGATISEILALFDIDTCILNERPLPADEITPIKLACDVKSNIYGGLDKLQTRICLRGNMQIKDYSISWLPTTLNRLLKYFVADAAMNHSKIFQSDFIQTFIQPKATEQMFVILNKKFSHFYLITAFCKIS